MKVNNIGISGFVLETKYNTDKSDLEKEIPDTSKLVKKTDYNVKISEIQSKVPSISGLFTTIKYLMKIKIKYLILVV